MKKLVVALCAVFAVVALVACGGSSLAKLSSEDNVAQANGWAKGVVLDAFSSLAADGVIKPMPDSPILLDEVLEFENPEAIAYKDAQAGQALEGDFSLKPGSKVILCSTTLSSDEPHVGYLDGLEGEDEEGNALPLFRPNRFGKAESTLPYLGDSYDTLMEGVSYDTFANGLAECDYLIAYDAIDTYVRKEYYVGGIDRTTVTTVAVVFDARNHTVAHIEVIGSDTPDGVHEGPSGELLSEDLARYLNALLKTRDAS